MGSAPATETRGVTRAAARAAPTKQVWLGSAGGWGHSPCQGADSPGGGKWPKANRGRDNVPKGQRRSPAGEIPRTPYAILWPATAGG